MFGNCFKCVVLGFASLAISLVVLAVSKLPGIFLSPMGAAIASGIVISSVAAITLTLLLDNEIGE